MRASCCRPRISPGAAPDGQRGPAVADRPLLLLPIRREVASASRPSEQTLIRDVQALAELLHPGKAQRPLAIEYLRDSPARPNAGRQIAPSAPDQRSLLLHSQPQQVHETRSAVPPGFSACATRSPARAVAPAAAQADGRSGPTRRSRRPSPGPATWANRGTRRSAHRSSPPGHHRAGWN